MANTQNNANETKAKTVTIRLPILKGEENQDVFVAVNDHQYLIKRGESVEVPDFIAEAIQNSEHAELKAYEYINSVASK